MKQDFSVMFLPIYYPHRLSRRGITPEQLLSQSRLLMACQPLLTAYCQESEAVVLLEPLRPNLRVILVLDFA